MKTKRTPRPKTVAKFIDRAVGEDLHAATVLSITNAVICDHFGSVAIGNA
jgi:hypothetical protein